MRLAYLSMLLILACPAAVFDRNEREAHGDRRDRARRDGARARGFAPARARDLLRCHPQYADSFAPKLDAVPEAELPQQTEAMPRGGGCCHSAFRPRRRGTIGP